MEQQRSGVLLPSDEIELHIIPTLDPADPLALVTSWHPKLSIYRLLVLLSTIGFGTAKAILTYRGETLAPITLEWLFTVVI